MSRRFTPTASYRIFLDLLVKARTDLGVSQEELATRLDLSPAQVAKYENGERQIDFVQTRDWCVALGVSFLDFMVRLDREITAQLSQNELSGDAPGTDADPTEGGAR